MTTAQALAFPERPLGGCQRIARARKSITAQRFPGRRAVQNSRPCTVR